MINILNGPIGHGSNTNQSGSSGQIGHANPTINPTGATGNSSNIDQSGAIDNYNTNTASSGQAITINKPVENPTGATGNSSNIDQSGAIDNGPVANNPTGAVGHSAEEKKGITDLYMQDGDDYYIDDTALSNAQMRTGDDKKADSVVGSGGDSSETNSNINTGIFGGSSRAAHPGYSLW